MDTAIEIDFSFFYKASCMKMSITNLSNRKLKVEILDALKGMRKDGNYFGEARTLKSPELARHSNGYNSFDVNRKNGEWKKLKRVWIEMGEDNVLRIYLWRHLKGAMTLGELKNH